MIAPERDSESSSSKNLFGDILAAPVSLGRRFRRWWWHWLIRLLMVLYHLVLAGVGIVGRFVPRHPRGRCEILLTGTFYSDNWVLSHIKPLAAANHCSQVVVVSTYHFSPVPKVIAVYPPEWLQSLIGRVPARLLVFVWEAFRRRPDIVGGFHLMFNGMLAAVVARLVGGRSLYFSVGGGREILGGGAFGENRLFSRMETFDPIVEQQLIRVVRAFDLVVTMGTRAKAFFEDQGVHGRIYTVPGGIGNERFKVDHAQSRFDLILVGRLAKIKRIDRFLEAVAIAARRLPSLTAVIVGDGILGSQLRTLAHTLGIGDRVTFAGHQQDVGRWLSQARVFVLTSDSEGLALSLMEAMTCGLPAVVPNVGDLGDLVEDGVNGYLVDRREPEAFAERITSLIASPERYEAFAAAAQQSATRYAIPVVTRQWDAILESLNRGAT